MQSTFPFLLLPPEIRTHIYRLSLVDHDPFAIEMFTTSINGSSRSEPLHAASLSDIVRGDQEVHLSHFKDIFNIPSESKTSLLLACRTVYQEAIRVLYSSTYFQFWTPLMALRHPDRSCDALICFEERLSERNRTYIQRIEIECPKIERREDGRSGFMGKERDVLEVLKRFPALRYLKLNLNQDILSCDIPLLSRIQLTIPSTCHVDIEFGKIDSYDSSGLLNYRSVRISDQAIRQMTNSWGWKNAGHREVVGKDHEFSDEGRWVQWLEQSRLHGERAKAKQLENGEEWD
ncbi:MAG: hypothetical protein Q9199_007893 [Rusavskia elegans]